MKHTVTFPGGRKVSVEAPKDADDEEIFSFALHSLILGETAAREKQDEVIAALREQLGKATDALALATGRIGKLEAWVERKAQERPPAPAKPGDTIVKVNPEVRVVSDPGVHAAILASGKASDKTVQAVADALGKLAAQPKVEPAKPAAPTPWVFDVEHDTNPRSPKFGRMTRVIATPTR